MSMSQADKEKRMKEIVAKTKRLFLQDADRRAAELNERIASWRSRLPGHDAETANGLGDGLYRFAHTLKGVALTVGCDRLHRLSEAADSYSIQHLDAWTEDSLLQMISYIEELFTGLRGELQAEGLI
ncbi:Hpt domain-containing protein [Paenibacillus piri]|uniref:HPt domain-containing protein n=1 Tax=Paenibacillus piri TaxID=2547395 RepID=A0A4R5KXS1_9BACL|nr:Hpt domain-containing protein [Paenibacillus piri]TDG00383.1 hypothetical protein E1757_01735 [Paenibacillus piri]